MYPPLFETARQIGPCTRETLAGEVRVTVGSTHTWYKIPFRQLTEFKQAIRAEHKGARVGGRHPHYEVNL